MTTNSITPYLNIPQSQASILIEEIVDRIERSEAPAFHVTRTPEGKELIEPSKLSKRFAVIQQLIDIFADHYDYSEHLQVFWKACQDIGIERSPLGPTCLDATGCRYLSFAETMNVLVSRIRQLTREPEYRRKAHDRRYQSQQKTEKLDSCVRAVMSRYSRTVVVRVDLHYLSIVQPLLRIEHLYADLSSLIRSRERNPIFEHEIGYAWSIEQGKNKGFHIHCVFFFNGAKVYSDWFKSMEIGKLWIDITGGRGYFHSCNDEKATYSIQAVGTFKRADEEACQNVIKAMRYLTKDDQQHLRIKPAGARTFGTGLYTGSPTGS